MTKKIDNILFDLDGTLTNPKEGIINSILYALNKLDIPEYNVNDLSNFIGPPLKESFKTRYNLTDSKAEQAIVAYREYFSTKGLFENELYIGVIELLEALRLNNFKLFVATSKPTVYAKQILKHFNIEKHFIEIIGSNLDNSRTDKTEIISHAVSTHKLQASKSIMVGDRKYDIIGAKKNSVKTIGVTYGYGSLEELTLCKPDLIAENCTELKTIFLKLPVPNIEY